MSPSVRAAAPPATIYALLAILVIPVFPHFTSPNELSRWALTVAIVDEGTIEVTDVLARTGLTRIEDISSFDGKLYSNKAPGLAFLAVPSYAIYRLFGAPASADSIRPSMTVMRFATATIPAIALAFWLAATAARFGRDADRIRFAITILLFATPLFAYGLLFFSHAWSALALFGAFALLFMGERDWKRQLGAGLLLGAAVFSEYTNAIPAATLIACALPRLRWRGVVFVLAGGAPFAAALGWYNRVAFGSAFALSSGHEADPAFRELAGSGLFGIGWPSLPALMAILADPSKGLLILSPILLAAILGFPAARAGVPRGTIAAIVTTPLALLLFISGYPNWHGGWTVGVRYAVAIVPFAVLLIAFARRTIAETLLLGASAGAIAMLSLVFPFVPENYPAPWISFSWPILREGLVAPNLLHLVWRPAAVVMPFLLVIVAVIAALPSRRLVAAAAAGFALSVVVGIAAQRLVTPRPPLVRLIVEEAYFEREGTIARALPPGAARERLQRFASALRHSPPSSWPF